MSPSFPLLDQLLAHPFATDLCLNGQKLFVDFGSGLEPQPWEVSEEELKTWILQELSFVGKTWDAKNPFIDATLRTGHRVHVVFSPICSQGLLISLRRLPRAEPSSGFERWRKQASLYQQLIVLVQRGDSLLISGATGSGKTTLITDLISHIAPSERIIALEDTPELRPFHPHFLSLISRPPNPDGFGEVTLRTLLRQTLRMRPDRIILGECRGSEVLELLQALNTGHRGAMATLHANSPRDALRRIELLCLLASTGSALPLLAIRELLSLGVQWLVQVHQREITELWKVEGREGETILLRPMTNSTF